MNEARDAILKALTERDKLNDLLLINAKRDNESLKKLLTKVNDEWAIVDGVYRFYHHSYKVFYLQDYTLEIISALKNLLPNVELNEWFLEIVNEGTNKKFSYETTNKNWLKETRPILEALFHARYFLEQIINAAEEMKDYEKAPQLLPSGWAAALYLFNIR